MRGNTVESEVNVLLPSLCHFICMRTKYLLNNNLYSRFYSYNDNNIPERITLKATIKGWINTDIKRPEEFSIPSWKQNRFHVFIHVTLTTDISDISCFCGYRSVTLSCQFTAFNVMYWDTLLTAYYLWFQR